MVSSSSREPIPNPCMIGSGAHYHDVIMTMMASQITASQLFTQPFVQAQIDNDNEIFFIAMKLHNVHSIYKTTHM